MMNRHQIQSIVSRHHPDPTEADRTCRACGRPWPCDVQRIAGSYETGPTLAVASRERVRHLTRRPAALSEALTF